MPGFIAIPLLLAAVIGLYMLSYVMNNKTKAPEGIEGITKCSTCGSGSCSLAGTNVPQPKDSCELEILN
jgi:hypothetical protein